MHPTTHEDRKSFITIFILFFFFDNKTKKMLMSLYINHSCQNVNCIMNRFLIFLYRILYRKVYYKIHKHLIKFIKKL